MKNFSKKKLLILSVLFSYLFLLSANINIARAVAPSVPSGITVQESTSAGYLDGSLTVKWAQVTNATSYSVKLTRQDNGSSKIYSVDGGATVQNQITGLIGGVTYVAQVKSYNLTDGSAWSLNSLTATPKTYPKSPAKPSVVGGIGRATVSWSLLTTSENGGSNITSYFVKEINSGKSVSALGTESSAIVTGLTNGAGVEFTVSAINAAGTDGSTSVKSDKLTLKDLAGVPDAPVLEATTKSDEVKATWTAPTSDGGSGITGFALKLIKDGVDFLNQVIDKVSDTFYTFTGLKPGSYTSKVLATNDVGDGPYSVLSNSVLIASASASPTPTVSATPSSTSTSTPSASPSASPTASPSRSSAPAPVSSSGSGGFSGGGGGGGLPAPIASLVSASPLPSPSNSKTPLPEPKESEKPNKAPEPIKSLVKVPTLTPSLAPLVQTNLAILEKPITPTVVIKIPTNNYAVAAPEKTVATNISLTAKPGTVSIKSGAAIAPSVPTASKGTTYSSTLTTPDGKKVTLTSGKTTKSGAIALPALKLLKPGNYVVTIKVGNITKQVTVTVKK